MARNERRPGQTEATTGSDRPVETGKVSSLRRPFDEGATRELTGSIRFLIANPHMTPHFGEARRRFR